MTEEETNFIPKPLAKGSGLIRLKDGVAYRYHYGYPPYVSESWVRDPTMDHMFKYVAQTKNKQEGK